jgi:hypothetical protein
MLGSSRVAAQLAASQEVLSSMSERVSERSIGLNLNSEEKHNETAEMRFVTGAIGYTRID